MFQFPKSREGKTRTRIDKKKKTIKAHKCMKVYYVHDIHLHVSATHVAIFRKVHCNEKTHRSTTQPFF